MSKIVLLLSSMMDTPDLIKEIAMQYCNLCNVCLHNELTRPSYLEALGENIRLDGCPKYFDIILGCPKDSLRYLSASCSMCFLGSKRVLTASNLLTN